MIEIKKEECVSCGLCAKACPFGSIDLAKGYPELRECRQCGACVEACPRKAIVIELKKTTLTEHRGVLVFAEQRDGKLVEVVYELLGKGRELAGKLDEPLYCVLLGRDVERHAKELVGYGADKAFVFEHPLLEERLEEPYSKIITALINEIKPSVFLVGATDFGRSLAPRIAARLGTGLTADCTFLDIDSEKKLLVQTRPAFGGNIMATIICPNGRPQMATVRYKVMKKAVYDPARKGEVIKRVAPNELLESRVRILKETRRDQKEDVVSAEVIVAGGKGLGKEGFRLLKEFAKEIGAMVGASRPAVEEGWAQYEQQVGLSGKTVSPKIYLAFGISGAVQHVSGMESSEVIIAVNKDPKAPIFDIADFGIVGDANEILTELIKQVKSTRRECI
ncbi:electron transfer flavoprotein subunit alpha [Candidatus Micrarchaeota archaeon]|nr:electron transfer flavoprotein subunit alpha [Candidatus Micrarchaeota archaeon]